jgi:hypothetical protein
VNATVKETFNLNTPEIISWYGKEGAAESSKEALAHIADGEFSNFDGGVGN